MGILGPLGPRPLLMADNIESAGCELQDPFVVSRQTWSMLTATPQLTCDKTAAAAPAVIPLPKSIPSFFNPPKFALSSSLIPLRASS